MRAIGGPSLYLNDLDVGQFGMTALPPEDWLDGPGLIDRTAQVMGRAGAIRLGTGVDVNAKPLTINGIFLADTLIEAQSLWDQILSLLGGAADVEVRFANQVDRMAYARYRGIKWQRVAGHTMGAPFSLSFEMLNPFKQARQTDVYSLPNGIAVPIALGSAASDVGLAMVGLGLADPAVLYTDAQGSEQGDVSFILPLAGGGLGLGTWIAIDGEFGIPYFYAGGTISNLSAYLDPSRHDFAADPADRDATTGPTLTAVNCNAVAYVRKAWQ